MGRNKPETCWDIDNQEIKSTVTWHLVGIYSQPENSNLHAAKKKLILHPVFVQQRPPPPSQPVSLVYNTTKGAPLQWAQALYDRNLPPPFKKNTSFWFELNLKSLKYLPNWEF
jgi:hypothetical protein